MTAAGQSLPTITKSGFTTKVIQLNGPCDWPSWDPKTDGKNAAAGPCGVTAAQVEKYLVGRRDLAAQCTAMISNHAPATDQIKNLESISC